MPHPHPRVPSSGTPWPRRLLRVAAVLAAAWAGLPGAMAQIAPDPAQRAGAPAVAHEMAGSRMVIRIHAPAGAGVKSTRAGQDLLLSFAQAAPRFDAGDLQRRAGALLEGIITGHDTVLLRLAPGVGADVETTPAGTTITLWAGEAERPVTAVPDPGSDRGGTDRLDLLRARLVLHGQDIAQARRRFEALRREMPGSAAPVAGLAAVEQQAGRWRLSAQLYRQAAGLEGGDPTMLGAARQVERAQGSNARADFERRDSQGGNFSAPMDLKLGEARGFRRFSDAWGAGVDVDAAQVDTTAIQRASGAVTPFSGRRNRAELFAQHDAMSGAVTVGSLFVGEGTGGAGVSHRRPDDWGVTSVALEYQRHNWDYVEGIIERAARDRVAVARLQRLPWRLTGRVLVAYNRYGLPDEDDVARTTGLNAEIRYGDAAGVPGLSLSYQLDAEYVDRLATRSTAANASFSPLPLVDREVHAALIGYARTLGNRDAGGAWSFDAYGGFGEDRYGGSGSLAFAVVGYAREGMDMRLRAGRVIGISQAGASTNFVGAQVSYQF